MEGGERVAGRRVAAALLALLVAAPVAAQEREEIVSYDVEIRLADGGRMDVTETLAVRVLGEEIRRGIYRDFPTSFPRASGLGRIEAPFEVLEVQRDGAPEPYALESIGGPLGRGGVRVRIGHADVTLERRVHTYTIRYRTWRWVAFGEREDQLYWNVTGNGWGFPILRASAAVVPPRPVDGAAVRLESWTGPEGSRSTSASATWDASAGAARFATEVPLTPGEGLTVRATFPKGVLMPPSAAVQRTWFRMDWGGWIDAASVVGLVLALYLLMWSRVGRDPARGTLVVRYEPPPGFSPASLGYLRRRGFDESQLTAALVSSAVQGAIRIGRAGREWTLHRAGDAAGLSSEERVLHEGLLGSRKSLDLKAKHASTISKAVKAFRKSLERRHEREYFVLNRRWFAVGLALSVAGLAALAWRDRYGIPPEAWFFCLWLSFWSIGVGTLLWRAWRAWKRALGSGGGFGSWVEAIFLSLFATPFVGAEIVVGGMLAARTPQHLVGAAVALGLVNVLFYHLLERPTLRGRGVLNEVEGFRAFLAATDADRLDRLHEPDRTPELFERYLPHAIALGVENRWADHFERALVPQAVGGAAHGSAASFAPAWFAGSGVSSLSGMASSLGSSFSSSLSAASSPPSSGGGGGGGSSGGGGGGGGGGGW